MPITIPTIYAAYASLQDYRAYIGKGSPKDDVVLEEELVATSRWWDRRLRRPAGFRIDEVATSRIYYAGRGEDGCGSKTLFIDDIGSASGVSVKIDTDGDRDFSDEVALAAGDYELWPPNAPFGTEPNPFDRLIYRGDAGGWPLDTAIQVTGYHGWPATPGRIGEPPALIKALTIEWCAVWRGESIRTTSRVAELDEVISVSPFHLSQMKRVEEMYKQSRRPYVKVGI